MKRIWNAIGKSGKDANFQKKAVKQFEKIESGYIKVAAPKVPMEEKRFEAAQGDTKIRQELAKKHETLVDNIGKITIRSIDPPKKENPDRPLPTRASEFERRNDPVWEFGFYEPPEDKIPKGKLMFREALEVVNKHELQELQDYLKGHTLEQGLTDVSKEGVKRLLNQKVVLEEYDRLGDTEKKQFVEAVKTLRAEEHERLDARLKQINEIEEGIKNAKTETAKSVADKKEDDRSK